MARHNSTLALFALAFALFAGIASAQDCPIDPETTTLNFTGVATGCGALVELEGADRACL